MGNQRALYNVPENFHYYHEFGEYLFIGRGMEQRLTNYLNKHGIFCAFDYQISRAEPRRRYTAEITPRAYQEGDVEQIVKHSCGVIRLGTGYGKTVIACQVIQSLQRRTLIIVPRTHLVEQFRKEIKKWFGLEAGIIQGERIEDRDISIASVQTLVRNPKIASELNNKFGLVLVDECHGAITDKQLEVIQTFCPQYLYGLTATPRRTDKQGDAIFFTFGDIIIDKDLPRGTPKVVTVPCHEHIEMDEYSEIIKSQVENKERNQLIIHHILNELQANRKILVLTKRVAHYELISHQLESIQHGIGDKIRVGANNKIRIHEISSATNAKDRLALLDSLRNGDQAFDVILGTYSMLATGTDIPALDTLIFAGDLRSDVLQEQSVGRILRLFGDKAEPKIIDIIDYGNKILYNQGRERSKFYKKMNWL